MMSTSLPSGWTGIPTSTWSRAPVPSPSRGKLRKGPRFFREYQDRVLYGTDLITATGAAHDEYPAFQRAKTAEEAVKIYRLDYQNYAGTGTVDFDGAEVECRGLPRNILDKFYYSNAQRIIPRLTE